MRSVAISATLLFLCLPTCLAGVNASPQDGPATTLTDPDDGKIEDGVYSSRYFSLSYPLLRGWTQGLASPPPSHSGYYVLSTLMAGNGERAMILLTAHDTFFAAAAFHDGAAMARDISRTMSTIEGTTIDLPPAEVTIAGRPFSRIDYSGLGLYRSALITPIRCHLVSFNITTANPEMRAALVKSLDGLGIISGQDAHPACKPNQAPPERLLMRVDPPAMPPYAPPVPVRLIIGAGGDVKHVHVIRATTDQRKAIVAALGQWRFRPPSLDDGAMTLETGMLVEFTAGGEVNYLSGERAAPY
jgi:hypothetical protein